jgi:glycosyltransferase involved in cell wall biosynthesis
MEASRQQNGRASTIDRGESMRFLFFSYDPPWPIRGGQQLHTYYMIRALASLGHDVHLTTYGDIEAFPTHKHKGWSVSRLNENDHYSPANNVSTLQGRIAERWMQYWGVPLWIPSSMEMLVQEYRPDAAIVVGLQALPVAAAITSVPTVWYAADDWVLHHLTLAQEGSFLDRIKSLQRAILSLCYERSLSSQVGGAIAVSKRDQRALRLAGGFQRVSLIPNGVDADFFEPRRERESEQHTVCFWGRMDFAPNIDAMVWFCRQIWPEILHQFPDAMLTIVGADPAPSVRELGKERSVRVTGEVDDIRPFAWYSQVVVMPIRTGGGIKNKLLEACSMGKSIIASQTAVAGLEIKDGSSVPWIMANNKNEWIEAIKLLWANPNMRLRLGDSARNYSEKHHSWIQAAKNFTRFINQIKRGS